MSFEIFSGGGVESLVGLVVALCAAMGVEFMAEIIMAQSTFGFSSETMSNNPIASHSWNMTIG